MEQDQTQAEHKKFGAYLRRVREDRRLSLDSVEELTVGYPERITKSHLSRIETGQAVPTFPRLFALSQIYGVPISCLAERFEIELRRGMAPDVSELSDEGLRELAREHRFCGRYVEALHCYEALLDRWDTSGPVASAKHETGDRRTYLRIERVSCLVQLRRYVVAKEEAEDLLGDDPLESQQRAMVLELFATCCYRLGKYTVALLALDSVGDDFGSGPGAMRLEATFYVTKANLFNVTGREREAIPLYRQAADLYEKLPSPFEACRARLNLAGAQIEIGQFKTARRSLLGLVRETQERGFDRETARVHSNLAIISFREGDLQSAEAHCLRSNAIARPQGYTAAVFRNCYYLWKIAAQTDDRKGLRLHEKALRSYIGRLTESIPEADDFRTYLAGSEPC